MLSKILAGVFAAGVLTTGAYVYSTGSMCCHSDSGSACPAASTDEPSCCQQATRTSCFNIPPEACCEETDTLSEVLAIQPREVK